MFRLVSAKRLWDGRWGGQEAEHDHHDPVPPELKIFIFCFILLLQVCAAPITGCTCRTLFYPTCWSFMQVLICAETVNYATVALALPPYFDRGNQKLAKAVALIDASQEDFAFERASHHLGVDVSSIPAPD